MFQPVYNIWSWLKRQYRRNQTQAILETLLFVLIHGIIMMPTLILIVCLMTNRTNLWYLSLLGIPALGGVYYIILDFLKFLTDMRQTKRQ